MSSRYQVLLGLAGKSQRGVAVVIAVKRALDSLYLERDGQYYSLTELLIGKHRDQAHRDSSFRGWHDRWE